jgi:hypothetical protein
MSKNALPVTVITGYRRRLTCPGGRQPAFNWLARPRYHFIVAGKQRFRHPGSNPNLGTSRQV